MDQILKNRDIVINKKSQKNTDPIKKRKMNETGSKNLWGLFRWRGSDIELIHPDDRDILADYYIIAAPYECTDEADGYLTINFYGEKMRVRPETFEQLPITPKYRYDDWVKVRDFPGKYGRIRSLMWHFEKKYIYYLLQIKGTRRSTNWYRAEDLEKIDDPFARAFNKSNFPTEVKEKKHMLQIGLVGNGGSSATKFEYLYQKFKTLLLANTDKDYSESITDLMIVFCISGKIRDFGFEGFDSLRMNRQEKQLWIDYGIRKDFFAGKNEQFIKEFLVKIVGEALEKFFRRIDKGRYEFDKAELFSDFQKASEEFLVSNRSEETR